MMKVQWPQRWTQSQSTITYTTTMNMQKSTFCVRHFSSKFRANTTGMVISVMMFITISQRYRTVNPHRHRYQHALEHDPLRDLPGCCQETPPDLSLHRPHWLSALVYVLTQMLQTTITLHQLQVNHLMHTVAIKHPVPDRVKPSFVIFDIRALWRSGHSLVGKTSSKIMQQVVRHVHFMN